jgi:class 3 adenylate cyclase/tetratricopeptide (TPR) repeat protein
MNCGFALSTPAPAASGEAGFSAAMDVRLTRIAATMPALLAEKMRSSAHLAGERRVVTALFADVVGSTSLAEQMDPEDWTEIMNQAFDRLVPAIYKYEGTITRLMGDALLAFFGAPVAHEDDPIRAVRAALDLVALTSQFSEDVRRRYGIDFAIRVGLNTGPVVVGDVGSNLVYEYTAMGDAVNLAARMQSAARPMTVLITDNTYRFIAPIFEVHELGNIAIKGKTDPVRAYEVVRTRLMPGSVRGLGKSDSPTIGRELQLTMLASLSQSLQAGNGRACLIIGEAGIGKTRLVNEWKALVAEQRLAIDWLEGHSLSYGQGLAYHLLVDLLRSMLKVTASTGESTVRTALLDRCQSLLGENALEVFPYLSHLLTIRLEGEALERVRQLDPQTLQAQYLFALRQLLQALAMRRPTAIILEDIHWADPSSVELLVKLLPIVREIPLLIVCLARPDRDAPGWRLVVNAQEQMGGALVELSLPPLDELESVRLIENLLEVDTLTPNMQDIILSKAEGNPFFVEEVIRMLIDRDALVKKGNRWLLKDDIHVGEIPDNLQGLLLARIDRLPEDVKHTLRIASVIGRRFPALVLEQVLAGYNTSSLESKGIPPTAPLAEQLNILIQAGLLAQSETEQEIEYAFTSALIHEAARASLVRADRRQLHQTIANTLEAIYTERLDEFAPLLADHFHHAGSDKKAMQYYAMAGNLALSRYANAEAARFYSNSLAIMRSLFRKSEEPEYLHLVQSLGELYQKRGQALWWSGSYNQALENYSEMEAFARAQGDARLELACLADLAALYSAPNPKFDAERGEQIALEAQQISRQLGDAGTEARLFWILMMNGFFSNQPQKAATYGDQALQLARRHELHGLLALTLADLAKYVYTPMMQFDTALIALDEAKRILNQFENKPRLSDAYLTEAIIYVNLGEFDRALELVSQGIEIARSIGSLWHLAYGWIIQGQVHLERGESDLAFRVLDDSYRTSELSGFVAGLTIVSGMQSVLLTRLGALHQAMPYSYYAVKTAENQAPFWLTQALGSQAILFVELGDLESAEAALARAHLHTREHFLGFFSNYIPMAECELLIKQKNYEGAIAAVDQVIETLYTQNANGIIPYFLYYKGMAFLGLENVDKACDALREACFTAEWITARWPWWRSLIVLAELHVRSGQTEKAQEFRQSARQVIDVICQHAGTAEMLRYFSEIPEIRRLIDST